MVEGTAAVLLIKPWAGYRVSATLVVPISKAEQLVLSGVARMVSQPTPEPADETESPDKPMKKRSK